LGKFYDRDEDARRVAHVLKALGASKSGPRLGITVPSVLAYHAPRRLLLLSYEPGESLTSAIGQDRDVILTAVGRALATLHALPVSLKRTRSPQDVLCDLQPRIADLCARFPSEQKSLRRAFRALVRDAPIFPGGPIFVHGDFGPANLLWRAGHVVVLDFDKCAMGDPASDLGNLFAQLFRMSIKKPEKLPDFTGARQSVLEAYERWSPADLDLEHRVAWYERATLLRKIHGLLFSKNRSQEPEAVHQRQAEAVQLLRLA
jgi:Ser/Thr protein kinase RdoA (MazF antagonist)